jgi:haloalkane dehalogenase
VAHDWGGVIATAFAGKYSDRVKRIVLFNTAGFLLPEGHSLHWTIRFVRTSKLAAFLVLRFNAFAFLASHLGTRKRMPAEIRRAYRSPYDTPANRLATLRFVQDIPLEETHPSYETLQQTDEDLTHLRQLPVLICWGGKDFVFNDGFLEEWKRRLPEAEVHYFPRAGHYVLEDAGAEILPIIRSFFDEHPVDRGFSVG